jgi:hypothetical protein
MWGKYTLVDIEVVGLPPYIALRLRTVAQRPRSISPLFDSKTTTYNPDPNPNPDLSLTLTTSMFTISIMYRSQMIEINRQFPIWAIFLFYKIQEMLEHFRMHDHQTHAWRAHPSAGVDA